jgi:hypothetical protein
MNLEDRVIREVTFEQPWIMPAKLLQPVGGTDGFPKHGITRAGGGDDGKTHLASFFSPVRTLGLSPQE